MMAHLHEFIQWLNGYLWGYPMLILLFGTHIFLTIRLRWIQKYIWVAIKLSFKKDPGGQGDVSHFGALATALAATVGTGNIVGVATAITMGGPGAVLWMWLTGVFGIATKYSEALLAVKYRVKTSDGTMLGGPMYVLERGLNSKPLAVMFCIFTAIAAFGIGNMVQSNSISRMAIEFMPSAQKARAELVKAEASGDVLMVDDKKAACLKAEWNIQQVTGAWLALLTAVVILGGVKSISRVCAALVPFMVIFYVAGCVYILFANFAYIDDAVKLIIKHAFTPQAAGGGFAGATVMMAMRYGVARGLFSNESGLGSAPIVAAAAKTKNPVRQALVSATGTFWDTVVVCLITGLVLVTTMVRFPDKLAGLKSAGLTQAAFGLIPVIGPAILIVGLFTFVYSTIIGWSYYGERAVEYLAGKKSILPYRLLWVAAVYIGAVVAPQFIWDVADSMNALMAIPNILSLLLLSGIIVSETKKYLYNNNLDGD